jgi:putative oxidoreductase
MNIVLWVLQVLLAAQFLFHGYIMVFPPAGLAEIINAQFSTWFRLFVGITESLGALGLLLPEMTRIMPWLTPLAGLGLMIVAISASVLHFSRGETGSAITTVVLFVLLAFVSYMRWKVKPVAAQPAA